jgi:proline iminopeptidase
MNRPFFPEINPFHQEFLKVSSTHEIYVEQVGNPKGYPILFLHGGPGGGTSSDHRRYFDPQFYRIILFDQRGCGQSRPFAELKENSTWDLVRDIETIREHLKIDQWHVFGGSWGSTLALCYGIKHASRVSAFILRGIFLCRPEEISWFYQKGASQLFPDLWEEYLKPIPELERGDMVKAYYSRLTSLDRNTQLEAAKAWSKWEGGTSYLLPKPSAVEEFDSPEKALPFARIECHYFINNAFLPSNNYILENISSIKSIPAIIVQGRYDVVCPATSAWELHRVWPGSQLELISDAGHSASEPGIRSALIQATEHMKKFA